MIYKLRINIERVTERGSQDNDQDGVDDQEKNDENSWTR